MRIIDTYGKWAEQAVGGTAGAGSTPRTTRAGASEPPAPPNAGGEKVTVSSDAQKLAAAAETAKLDKLRAAIQDGSFKVDHHAIAKRIVDGG